MKIITVSREFGSGGREIAKRLSDVLGIAYGLVGQGVVCCAHRPCAGIVGAHVEAAAIDIRSAGADTFPVELCFRRAAELHPAVFHGG